MGSGGSVSRKCESAFHAVFVDVETQQEIKQLPLDPVLRINFIDYLKGGTWIDKLSEFEDSGSYEDTPDVWCRFGYEPPNSVPCGSPVPKLANVLSRDSFLSMLQSECTADRSEDSEYTESLPKWVLCEKQESLRSFLILIVLPYYLKSSQYRSSKYQLNISSTPSSPTDSYSRACVEKPARATRLRSLLHSAATAFDGLDIDEYLRDPATELVNDFKNALEALPLMVRVIEVDKIDWKPFMLFENSSKFSSKTTSSRSTSSLSFKDSAVDSIISHSRRLSISGFSGKVREEQYGLDPEQEEMVQKAIDERRPLKIVIRSGEGRCVLRAMKPVFDEDGCFKYMISVETIEKINIADTFHAAYKPQLFQQVDDALLLLPLLVKK